MEGDFALIVLSSSCCGSLHQTLPFAITFAEDMQVWKCEFCNTDNTVSLEEEEKPQTKAVNYILEAAAQIQDKKVMGQKDISVVFCVDQSGSMCCSQPI